jgi:hypothetical protein
MNQKERRRKPTGPSGRTNLREHSGEKLEYTSEATDTSAKETGRVDPYQGSRKLESVRRKTGRGRKGGRWTIEQRVKTPEGELKAEKHRGRRPNTPSTSETKETLTTGILQRK